MGYTHYWSHGDVGAVAWATLVADARRVVEVALVALAGPDGEGLPVVNAEEIALNGVAASDDDGESFVLGPAGTSFDFCKTGRRPYDFVVTALLLRAALTVPGFEVWSDGDWSDWSDGRRLYARVFEMEPSRPPGLKGE